MVSHSMEIFLNLPFRHNLLFFYRIHDCSQTCYYIVFIYLNLQADEFLSLGLVLKLELLTIVQILKETRIVIGQTATEQQSIHSSVLWCAVEINFHSKVDINSALGEVVTFACSQEKYLNSTIDVFLCVFKYY